jgi:hypothetical protein
VEGLAAAKEALLTGFDMWASHQTQQATAQVKREGREENMILRASSCLATEQDSQKGTAACSPVVFSIWPLRRM